MRTPTPHGHPIGHMDVPTSTERIASPTPAPRDHLQDLVVVPDLMRNFDRSIAVAQKFSQTLAAYDADRECRHGRLPTDSTPPCGCWPGEGPEEGLVDIPAETSTKAKRAPSPTNGRAVGLVRNDVGEQLQRILCNCGREWTRPAGTRGRVPKCPTCRGVSAS